MCNLHIKWGFTRERLVKTRGFLRQTNFIEIALVHLQSHRSLHSARLSFEVTELRNNQFVCSVICSCCGLTSGIASAQTPPLFSVICTYVDYLHIHTWTRIYIYICIWFHICVYINTNIYEYTSKLLRCTRTHWFCPYPHWCPMPRSSGWPRCSFSWKERVHLGSCWYR